MNRTWKHRLRDLGLATLSAFLFVGIALPAAAQNPPPKDPPKDAKDTPKDAAKDAKDATKDARDTAKDAAKDPRNTPKAPRDTAKDPRDTAKDPRDTAKDPRDTAKDPRDSVKDPKDPRPTPRDPNPPSARDPRDTRDPRDNRDPRDTRDDRSRVGDRDRDNDRDRARDRDRDRDNDRDRVRDRDRDNDGVRNRRDRDDRRDFNVNTYRSADMGLWFTTTNNQLVISDIATTGPIARLGFHEHDRIVSVNGHSITTERDFIRFLYAEDIRNDRVKVVVIRDGREEVIFVEPIVFIEHTHASAYDPLEDFGIILDDRVTEHLVVWRVIPRTPAYYAGIRAGDVLVGFDGTNITAVSQLVSLVRSSNRDTVAVKVMRNQKPRTLDVEFTSLQTQDDSDRRDNDRRDPEPERRSALKPDPDAVKPAPPATPPVAPEPPAVKPVIPVAPAPTTPAPQPRPERPRPGLLPRNR